MLVQGKIILIYSFILIFPDQTIMALSVNGATCESDVTSLGTGQRLNFDGDTQKGKDKGKSVVVSVVIAAKCL